MNEKRLLCVKHKRVGCECVSQGEGAQGHKGKTFKFPFTQEILTRTSQLGTGNWELAPTPKSLDCFHGDFIKSHITMKGSHLKAFKCLRPLFIRLMQNKCSWSFEQLSDHQEVTFPPRMAQVYY